MREIRNEQFQLSAFHEQLLNGLDVYVIPMPGYSQTFALFSTKYGSIDREFIVPGESEPTVVPDGIAHFLEHKMFEQESGEDVFKLFAKYGASSNAFTSFDTTAYLFSTTSAVEENLNILLDYVQDPYFTDENVEKEKGIIGQEIRMYEDNPGWVVYFNLLRGFYKDHPIKIDIAGTIESISQITKETLYKCYNTFYHPSNMNLVVVGDVDPARIIQVVRDNQARKDFKRQPDIQRIYPEEADEVAEARIEAHMAVSILKVYFGYKDMRSVGLTGNDLIANEYATAIGLEALIGNSSSLFNRLYESGLIDKQFGWSYDVSPLFAHSAIGGNSPDPEQLLQTVFAAFAEAREKGIKKEDFERAKRKLIGQVLSDLDSPRGICRQFALYNLRGADFFETVPVLESLTLEQVNQRLQEHLREECRSVSLILPKQ
jgi:predicted Zn-dependent peptidase